MFFLYSFLVSLLLGVISYPFLKFYQLCGYKVKKFLSGILYIPFKLDDKNSLVLTKRMFRFLILYGLLLLVIFIPIFLFISNFWLILLGIVVVALIIPLIISSAHIFIWPFELSIQRYYIVRTKKKLKNFKGIKIAIVGSFGKTSFKNILYEILKDKFKTVVTPQNFNTPMGISKTIRQYLKEDTEIAIFEMGARKEGDIKQLMEIVDPNIGVMTAVGEQHLETFKNLKTILKTKNELVTYMQSGGRLIFNGASENTKILFKRCKKKKCLAVDENGFSNFKDLAYSQFGLNFEMIIDKKSVNINTLLLGKFNAENIVLASTVAYILGVDLEYIAQAIKKIKPVKNRLELIRNGKLTIIDDSYNANPVGCSEALNVLKLFNGEKIVVTSGMVELGSVQYEKNFILGKQIAGIANKVLIMNEINKKAILEGLKVVGFNEDQIFFAKTREEQKEVLKEITKGESVILFQNDLPDTYR